MLENSRKRARKSKLEVREGVELEESTVLYMEALETKVKDEPMIDVGPTLISKNKGIEDPFNNIAIPTSEHMPLMEFSVKIEVEECDETGSKENANTCDNQNNVINGNISKCSKTPNNANFATKSLLKDIKPDITNTKTTTCMEVETDISQKNVTSKEFKEYVTNRPMMLKITERLMKSDQIADKLLAVGIRNYAGRILDEPLKDSTDMLIYRAFEDWQLWHLEHSAVRDIPLIYKCYICGISWWYLYDFREHLNKHVKSKQFEVSLETNNDECSLICFQLDIVYNDVELPVTNCDRCGKTADSHAFVDNEPYKCMGCKTTFTTCTQLQLHENQCYQYRKLLVPAESKVQKCRICSFECNTETNLNDHMIRRHTPRSDSVITWDVKKCNICSRTNTLTALHVCVRKTNNYGCNYCGRSFQKKIYKEIHMVNYNKQIKCRLCEKTLMTGCMEFSHMLQHTDRFALMYKCIQCMEGRYYPDEFSIVHHTKTVHNRPFEKKFKYLEMVILPKQCLEKSSRSTLIQDVPARDHSEANYFRLSTDNYRNEIAKGDIANCNVFVPSTKYRATNKQLEIPIDVVVKEEPVHNEVDIDTLCVSDLSSIKTEGVDESSPHVKISDITSLQDFIKFKTEPVEEVVAEDLIIIEDKSETITLYSSDDSDNGLGFKYTGSKGKKLNRVACACGHVDLRSGMTAHKSCCAVTRAKRAAAGQPQSSSGVVKSVKDKSEGDVEDDSIDSANDEHVDAEEDELDNSDEEWLHGMPLVRNSKSGLIYTCHCKKAFVGTLAAFRRHKKSCSVVAKLKQQRNETKPPAVYACTKCNTDFNSILRYCKHLSRSHYFQKYACPQCLAAFGSLGKLTGHVTSHVNRTYLKMRLISESHEWTKINRCKICKKPVEREDYFKHWELHLVLNPGDGGAERDSDSVPDEDTLVIDTTEPAGGSSVYPPEVMQKALVWLQSPDGISSVDEKTCVFCARRFARKNDSKRHVIEHLLQDAYAQRFQYKALRCQICLLGFPKDDRFKLHMREHASLPVYQCNLCGKSFSDSSNFCKHRKVHGLSLMCCKVCDKKFHNSKHLARHMEMHERTKPIICDVCNKISYTQSAHKKHVRCVHERHRTRVLCPVCRVGFTRLKDKWDHMWVMHKERKFMADCPICSQAFRRFADVKSHVKQVHNRNVRFNADRQMVVYA